MFWICCVLYHTSWYADNESQQLVLVSKKHQQCRLKTWNNYRWSHEWIFFLSSKILPSEVTSTCYPSVSSVLRHCCKTSCNKSQLKRRWWERWLGRFYPSCGVCRFSSILCWSVTCNERHCEIIQVCNPIYLSDKTRWFTLQMQKLMAHLLDQTLDLDPRH